MPGGSELWQTRREEVQLNSNLPCSDAESTVSVARRLRELRCPGRSFPAQIRPRYEWPHVRMGVEQAYNSPALIAMISLLTQSHCQVAKNEFLVRPARGSQRNREARSGAAPLFSTDPCRRTSQCIDQNSALSVVERLFGCAGIFGPAGNFATVARRDFCESR